MWGHLSCGFFSINAVVTVGFPSEDSVNPGWKTVFSHFHRGFDLHFVESIDTDGPTVDSKIISRFSTAWRSVPLISTLFNGKLYIKQRKSFPDGRFQKQDVMKSKERENVYIKAHVDCIK